MKQQKLTHFLTTLLLVFAVGSSSVTADDTEIYLNSSSSSAAQNILFNLDTSGSMGSSVDENNNGVIDPGERSRIEVLREAMITVLDSLPSLNAGLMRYHWWGGPILYPVASLDQEACVVEGNCTSSTSPSGDIIVSNNLASDNDDVVQVGALGLVLDGNSLQVGENPAGICGANSGSVRISNNNDDAESHVSNANFFINSSDLEIPRENSAQQVVGLRFRDVDIPAGATITNAYIEFEVDSAAKAFSENYVQPIDVLIKAESMAGARNNFSTGAGEPETRLATNPSAATVNWETNEFPGPDDKLTTNNLASLLQEYVDDGAWPATGGDDMVFLIYNDPSAPATANGSRELESHDGEPSAAPLLVYEYEHCSSTSPTEMRTGLRFSGVSIPQGSTITGARIDFSTFNDSVADAPDFRVRVENADDAAAYVQTQNLTSRAYVSGGVDWTSSTTPALTQWVSSDNTLYSTPDLTSIVQTVVNRNGWCGGNAMGFMIERTGGANGIRYAYSMENDDSKAPVLTIEYDASSPQAGATGCMRSTIVKTIESSNDDVEQSATGSISSTSSDLELVEENSTQTVGLRFKGIPIAQGATINAAKIVFTADEVNTGSTSLTFHGQLSPNATAFSNSTGSLTDTTERPRTSASVNWSPNDWNTVGQTHEVTGLETIIQEIVNQGAWNPGNELALFISGSGKRVADSYDGDPATAPRLIIEFEGSPIESKITVRERMKDIVDGLIQSGGTPIAGTMIEAAHYFRGEGVRYGTQRGDKSSTNRNSNVSHPASYDANGATVTYPGSCTADNERHDDCKNQVISGGNPVYKSPIIAECQANYLVNLTDGGGYYTGDNLTNDRGQSLDERDLINAFVAKDDNGNTVTMPTCDTDTVLPDGTTYSGDSHNECTVKLAKFLHDYDQIYAAGQNLQVGTSPIAGSQTLDVYTIGFNMCGTGNVSSQHDDGNGNLEQVCCAVANHDTSTGLCSSPITDPDRIKVLKAQAAVAGGEYYNASTVDELVAAFTNITSSIVEKSTSFVAPSIAANAFNRLFSRDEVFFGLFEPSKTQRWDGNVKKYKVCIDSDIDDDGTTDCTLGNVLDANLVDAIVQPNPSNPPPDEGLFSTSAESLWTGFVDGRETKIGGAGDEITDYTGRTIYTDVSAANGQALTGDALSASGYKLDASNWDSTAMSAVRDEVCPDPTIFTSGSDCQLRMEFMLGFDSFDEDQDSLTDTRWWFHDVLHSSPTNVTYGKTSGGAFIDKLLVATNDGALHFINGATGVEEWAFMPNALLSGQQSFYDNNAPTHTYGLDGSPVVGITDVDQDGTIEPADGDFVGVIITQRRGGDNIYALDITPTSTLTSTATTVVPKFLWHISSGTPGFSRLGQTWSDPVLGTIRTVTGTGASSKTVAVFGGGYDSDLDNDDGSNIAKNFGTEAGNPNEGNAIFVVDAATGDLIFSISGSGSGADIEIPDMIHAIPSQVTLFDSNGDGFDDRIYVGDTGGQVWRVDLHNVYPTSAAPEGDTVVGKLADISTAGTLAAERRFFYKPTVVQVVDTEFSNAAGGEYDYVLIGSGNRANPLDTQVEDRFYAFRDVNIGRMLDSNGDNRADTYPLTTTGSDNAAAIDNGDLLDVTTQTLVDIGASSSSVQNALGWYFDFNNAGRDGEKVLASSGVFAGTLIFTTYIPDDAAAIADVCSAAEGSGRAYNFNILSTAAALDWDSSANGLSDRSVVLGSGIPSAGVPIFTKEGVTVLVGTGGGSVNVGQVANLPRGQTYWNEQLD